MPYREMVKFESKLSSVRLRRCVKFSLKLNFERNSFNFSETVSGLCIYRYCSSPFWHWSNPNLILTASWFLRGFLKQQKNLNYILTEILLSKRKKNFYKAIRNKFSKKKKIQSKATDWNHGFRKSKRYSFFKGKDWCVNMLHWTLKHM